MKTKVNNKKKRVLFISGREVNYPRNSLFINALQRYYDLEIIGPKKAEISKGNYFRTILNSFIGIIKIIPKILTRKYSFIFIGFFGQFLILPISLITKSPIFFDFFVSAYDTLVTDRKIIKSNSLFAKFIYKLDKHCCKVADLIFVDTQANLNYYKNLFNIPPHKLKALYVGCNEDLFFPQTITPDKDLVLYYSSYMPLHGVDTIIKAAKILNPDTSIQIKIIGDGMEYKNIQSLVQALRVTNVSFEPPVPLVELPDKIAKASICLGGHFGDTEKAKRVIAGKTFQLLAMAKPTIVGDNEANHELLTSGKDAVFCKMNDPEALANAIQYLHKHQEMKEKIGQNGFNTYKESASTEVLEKLIYLTLEEGFKSK